MFVRRKYWISVRKYCFIHFRTENGQFKLFLRKGTKPTNINQKPNISSCLTSSEAAMNYVWHQATFSIIDFLKMWV